MAGKTLLAKVDIEVNSRSNNGNTPLSNAAFCGHLDVVKLLLARADVDVDSLDKHGETLLSRAERRFALDPSYSEIGEVINLLRATVQARSSSKDKG